MKATITFEYDPETPEEADRMKTFLNGPSWKNVVGDLNGHLRGLLKYSELSEEAAKALQETRDKLWEFVRAYNLDEDDL